MRVIFVIKRSDHRCSPPCIGNL